MAIMRQTQVSFTIHIDSDNEDRIIQAIQLLAASLMLLWQVCRVIGRMVKETILLAQDIAEACRFVSAVFVIGFKSFTWGLAGVRL